MSKSPLGVRWSVGDRTAGCNLTRSDSSAYIQSVWPTSGSECVSTVSSTTEPSPASRVDTSCPTSDMVMRARELRNQQGAAGDQEPNDSVTVKCEVDSVLQSEVMTAAKRVKLLSKDDPLPVKKRRVTEILSAALANNKDKYYDNLSELYFLKDGGQLMDLFGWRKRPPQGFLEYVRTRLLDHSEDESHRILGSQKMSAGNDFRASRIDTQASATLSASHTNSLVRVKEKTSLGLGGSVTSTLKKDLGGKEEHISRDLMVQTSASASELSCGQFITTSPVVPLIGDELAERAKHEAHVLQRVAALRKAGLWAQQRLPKVQEPPRVKAHWDYLIEEMKWMSNDFTQERKLKKTMARKCARMCQKYHQEKEQRAQRAEREEQQRMRKLAATIAKDIRKFWLNAEKLLEYRIQAKVAAKRKQALDIQLNLLVDKSEKFSHQIRDRLAVDALSNTAISSVADTLSDLQERDNNEDFVEESSEEDDEETIAKQEMNEKVDHKRELDELEGDNQLSLEELMAKYYSNESGEFGYRSVTPSADSLNEDENNLDSDEDEVVNDWKPDGDDKADIDVLIEGSGAERVGSTNKKSIHSDAWSATGAASEAEKDSFAQRSKYADDQLGGLTAVAEKFQPKGLDLATAQVKTPVPFLLKHTLREYQHVGLDWLVAMCDQKLNGILADEMGLGKTIQSIALLAHLAVEQGVWGPHLVVVPTSVMLNWEMEFKKWCPGFKILTYYGSVKERRQKRVGWTKKNSFHVCITSYKLVVQDHSAFRRKQWYYLILDEAQNIKNFKSQRWQLLLNFQAERRLLLTGTPLQNTLMELWSLMHFLMPHMFESHNEFREWFSNPLVGMVENSSEYNEALVKRLHRVLRPFLLRRLKSEVERQMPQKYEHVLLCRLSKRQRFLYDDFMSQPKTKETLASGKLLSVLNVLMQLRKVCNHPALFEARPVSSPFRADRLVYRVPSLLLHAAAENPLPTLLSSLNLHRADLELVLTAFAAHRIKRFQTTPQYIEGVDSHPAMPPRCPSGKIRLHIRTTTTPAAGVAQVARPPALSQTAVVATTASGSRVVNGAQLQRAATASTVVGSTASVTPASGAFPAAAVATGGGSGTVGPASTTQRIVMVGQRPVASDGSTSAPGHAQQLTFQLVQKAGQGGTASGSPPVTLHVQQGTTGSGVSRAAPAALHRIVQTTSGQHILLTTSSPHVAAAAGLGVPTTGAAASCTPGHTIRSHAGLVRVPVAAHGLVATSPRPSMGPAGLQANGSNSTSLSPVASSHKAVLATVGGSVGLISSTIGSRVATSGNVSARTLYTSTSSSITSSGTATLASPITSSTAHASSALASGAACSSVLSSKTQAQQLGSVIPVVTASGGSPLQQALVSRVAGSPAATAAVVAKPAGALALSAVSDRSPFYIESLEKRRAASHYAKLRLLGRVNSMRCAPGPVYGQDLIEAVSVMSFTDRVPPVACKRVAPLQTPYPEEVPPTALRRAPYGTGAGRLYTQNIHTHTSWWSDTRALRELLPSVEELWDQRESSWSQFLCIHPRAQAPPVEMHASHPPVHLVNSHRVTERLLHAELQPRIDRVVGRIALRLQTQFPDRRLIQFDCGKLQMLDRLLMQLKAGSHRVLIFTQMARMLDVLEQFLTMHGHTYLRLDGATGIERRQLLVERFNSDLRIFCFILSTRSGGVGLNLTGADTVVFYDSDWNPTMDAQAQDRCHRIGQTRDVHIYRLVSESTIEENILRKANQKRMLGELVIESGHFTTNFFSKNITDLFTTVETSSANKSTDMSEPVDEKPLNAAELRREQEDFERTLVQVEEESDARAATRARAEAFADMAEFDEDTPLPPFSCQSNLTESRALGLDDTEGEHSLMSQLNNIEKYALRFLEAQHDFEDLKQAEEKVETQKREWMLNRLKAQKDRLESMKEALPLISYKRPHSPQEEFFGIRDSTVSLPLWAPPTPPEGDDDDIADTGHIYTDGSQAYLYESQPLPENLLPPVYMRKSSFSKRMRPATCDAGLAVDGSVAVGAGVGAFAAGAMLTACGSGAGPPTSAGLSATSAAAAGNNTPAMNCRVGSGSSFKHISKEAALPKSLFDRPTPSLINLRKEVMILRLQRLSPLYSNAASSVALQQQPLGTISSTVPASGAVPSPAGSSTGIAEMRHLLQQPTQQSNSLQQSHSQQSHNTPLSAVSVVDQSTAGAVGGVSQGGGVATVSSSTTTLAGATASTGSVSSPSAVNGVTTSTRPGQSSQTACHALSGASTRDTPDAPSPTCAGAGSSETGDAVGAIDWIICEDWAILQAIQQLQELPRSLTIVSPGHQPNWDFVADFLDSTVSLTYRSPKQCRQHFENVLAPREEGRSDAPEIVDEQKTTKDAIKQNISLFLPVRTASLYVADGGASSSNLYCSRFESIKTLSVHTSSAIKPSFSASSQQQPQQQSQQHQQQQQSHQQPQQQQKQTASLVGGTTATTAATVVTTVLSSNTAGSSKNAKHAAVLADHGINYDNPLNPHVLARQRDERFKKEKGGRNVPGNAAPHLSQPQQQTPAVGVGVLGASGVLSLPHHHHQQHHQLHQHHHHHQGVQQQPQATSVAGGAVSSSTGVSGGGSGQAAIGGGVVVSKGVSGVVHSAAGGATLALTTTAAAGGHPVGGAAPVMAVLSHGVSSAAAAAHAHHIIASDAQKVVSCAPPQSVVATSTPIRTTQLVTATPVVSVTPLSPAQLQAAVQRTIAGRVVATGQQLQFQALKHSTLIRQQQQHHVASPSARVSVSAGSSTSSTTGGAAVGSHAAASSLATHTAGVSGSGQLKRIQQVVTASQAAVKVTSQAAAGQLLAATAHQQHAAAAASSQAQQHVVTTKVAGLGHVVGTATSSGQPHQSQVQLPLKVLGSARTVVNESELTQLLKRNQAAAGAQQQQQKILSTGATLVKPSGISLPVSAVTVTGERTRKLLIYE